MRAAGRALLTAVSLAALAYVVALVLLCAGRPLSTEDLWFHLKVGEMYFTQGPWPQADPTLFTAHGRPVQHEWLFGVLAYLLKRAFGFQGLRVIHALWAAAIVVLALGTLRRHSRGSLPATALATLAFVVLSWFRLVQFRPDLWTIPATILSATLLILPERGPSRAQIAGAAVLWFLWANVHSPFVIAIVLCAAAAVGSFIEQRAALSASMADAEGIQRPQWNDPPRRILTGVLIAGLLTLLNPRGIRQHLTFLLTSRSSGIWALNDEWHSFSPFFPGPPHNSIGLAPLEWALADAVLLLFAAVSISGYVRFKRRPSREALRRLDPCLFLVAAAAVGGMLISFRFLWLAIFPLLYVLRASSSASPVPLADPRPISPASVASALIAVSAAVIAALFPQLGRWRQVMADTPLQPSYYLSTPYNARRYADTGRRFLADTAVSGRLFSPYTLGSYLGYWLAPRLRVFIDGRTEHYPAEVMDEYLAVTMRSTGPGPSYREILDRRQVDFFFAVGGPMYGYQVTDTLDLLEGDPDWMPVYRSLDHLIYMRKAPRNTENLRRIAAYYSERGVPFDIERGFSVHDLVHAPPGSSAKAIDWAIEQHLLPRGYRELFQASTSAPDPRARVRALRILARVYEIAGDKEDAAQALSKLRAIDAKARQGLR